MIDIGAVCVKIAGRDAGKICIVVDRLENNYVIIDGNTRRRKCNVKHIEPLGKVLKIKKGATTAEIKKLLSTEGHKAVEKKEKTKTKKASEKPIKKRKIKEAKVEKPKKAKVSKKKGEAEK